MFFITLNKTLCIYLPPATAGIHLFLITSILPHLPMYACNSRHLFVPYNMYVVNKPLTIACNSRHLFVPYNIFPTSNPLSMACNSRHLFVPYNVCVAVVGAAVACNSRHLFVPYNLHHPTEHFLEPATAGIYLFLITRFAEKSFTISIHPYHITFEHF